MSPAAKLLSDVLQSIQSGNVPGPDELIQVEQTIQDVSPNLSQRELHELLDLVGQVQEAIIGEKASVQAELDRLSSERKAIRGYAQLRSHRHSQRINRKT